MLIIGMVGVQIEHLTVSWNERDKRSERQSQSELSLFNIVLWSQVEAMVKVSHYSHLFERKTTAKAVKMFLLNGN